MFDGESLEKKRLIDSRSASRISRSSVWVFPHWQTTVIAWFFCNYILDCSVFILQLRKFKIEDYSKIRRWQQNSSLYTAGPRTCLNHLYFVFVYIKKQIPCVQKETEMSFHITHLIYASEMQHVIIPFSCISLIRTQHSAPIKLQLVCCVLIVTCKSHVHESKFLTVALTLRYSSIYKIVSSFSLSI